ncbi:MAG: hypothetical protein P8Y74_18145 [Desulfobacterales bacterium]
MKILSFSPMAARLCLLIILVALVGDSYAFAWCRGDDGHIRLEQASVMGCIDKDALSSSARGQFEVAAFAADRYCGPCADYYIDADDILFTKRSNRLNKLAKAFVDTQKPQAAWPSRGQLRSVGSLQHPPGANQTLLALRTVVLLH